jgi:uncharacterized HAD superfamily protein
MNYKSIGELSSCIRSNLHKIPQDVDLIVGIPRSGLLAGSVLALHLNIPIVDLEGFVENRKIKYGRTRSIRNPKIKAPKDADHILVVDDSAWSGKSMAAAVKLIESANFGSQYTTCVAYVAHRGNREIDIYFEKVTMPRAFEWNIFHKRTLEECCVDIDGVLCVDPTNNENDDGEKYKRFLLNAVPLILPTTKIGALVTSRLEKYRRETQQWLEMNRIEYHDLVMLDLPDAATRRKLRIHGKFKAEVYRKYPGAHLFIESEARQAIEIAKLSGRSVLCFEDQRVYTPGTSLNSVDSGVRKFGVRGYGKVKRLLRKVLPYG